MSFPVLNADGIEVARYDNVTHAKEAAHDMAWQGSAEMLDFYTVVDDAARAEVVSYRSTLNGPEEMT